MNRHGLQIEQPEVVAGADPKKFPVLVRSQRVKLLLRICRAGECLLRLVTKILTAFEIGKAFVLSQTFEVSRISQQNLCEKLAVHKQFEEDLDGSRIGSQELQCRRRIWNRVDIPFEIEDGSIWIGGLGKRSQQHWQGRCQCCLASIVGAEFQQSCMCHLPVCKADGRKQVADVRFGHIGLKKLFQFSGHEFKKR